MLPKFFLSSLPAGILYFKSITSINCLLANVSSRFTNRAVANLYQLFFILYLAYYWSWYLVLLTWIRNFILLIVSHPPQSNTFVIFMIKDKKWKVKWKLEMENFHTFFEAFSWLMLSHWSMVKSRFKWFLRVWSIYLNKAKIRIWLSFLEPKICKLLSCNDFLRNMWFV